MRVKREFKENYIRIIKGYNPREPTTIFERIFYIVWCIFSGIHITVNRFFNSIREKIYAK